MTPTTNTQRCPMCGGTMLFECRDEVLEHRGHTRTINTLAWWCNDCDDGILDGKALMAWEKAMVQLRAEVDQIHGPPDPAHIREAFSPMQYAAG